ncbi:MAG: EAL domain-containing protein [Betaproteobacteria bacterium]|nr:EAL domain-containing protein [Betaproteobacteria bacterium]
MNASTPLERAALAAAMVPHAHDILDIAVARRFGVEYQPLVDTASGEIVGYEALARFYRANGEAVPPNLVFEALHESPLLLLHVELEMKRLQLAHAPPVANLFLNLDPDSFHLGEGLRHNLFVELFRQHWQAGRQITVEVIENLSIQDVERSREMISVLKGAGFGVALDDMGVAGTVVSYDTLSESSVVKFDRSWLERRSFRREAALRWFIGLSRELGVKMVLEGVEDTEQLAFARSAGFDWVQGRHFSDRFIHMS